MTVRSVNTKFKYYERCSNWRKTYNKHGSQADYFYYSKNSDE